MYSVDTLSTLSNMSFLSRNSRCYSFDHRANGYARGEGFGVIIIKPLSAALDNGDTIRAVIRATGTNQDGRTPGITQPSKIAQERLIKETYQKAGLDMKYTKFVEAHGNLDTLSTKIHADSMTLQAQELLLETLSRLALLVLRSETREIAQILSICTYPCPLSRFTSNTRTYRLQWRLEVQYRTP